MKLILFGLGHNESPEFDYSKFTARGLKSIFQLLTQTFFEILEFGCYGKAMYTTIQNLVRFDIVVKSSEFIALANHTETVTAALEWIKNLRTKFKDATHVAWAYRIGDQYRFSDDGEPSGTAGAPIYRSLEGSGLDLVTVAVVRYYGGTNLGAGGLVRAYGGVAVEVLRRAPKLEVHPRVIVMISVSFEQMNKLHKLLEKFNVQAREDEFTENGLNIKFAALETELEQLQILVRDTTRGQGVVLLERV